MLKGEVRISSDNVLRKKIIKKRDWIMSAIETGKIPNMDNELLIIREESM